MLSLGVGQGRTCRVLEHLPDTFACLCRALDVLDGADALLHFLALWLCVSIVRGLPRR